MKIKLLRDVTIRDHPGVKVGDVFDIHAERGEILVRIGDAELVETKYDDLKVTSAPMFQVRDPSAETRDPVVQPTPRKQPRKSV